MKWLVRRSAFWLMLIGYAFASIWWTLTVPHHPDDLLRAIPGHATMVSMHDQLADRWDEVSSHPLGAILAGMFGSQPEEWKELQRDPGFRFVLDLVGQRELALAYVPFLGTQQDGALAFASWVGGKSQRLRWSYPFLGLKDLRRLDDVGGWPVWTYTWTSGDDLHRLTFSLVEGMIIGSLARDPRSIELLIDAYNGAFPSIRMRRDLESWTHRLMHSAYNDRILYKQPGWPESRYWLAELDMSDHSRLAGVVLTDGNDAQKSTTAAADVDAARLAGLWGSHAIAVCALDTDWLRAFIQPGDDLISRLYRDVVQVTGARSSALGLFGGEMSGRFKGIRVPTLMAAFQMDNGTDVKAQLAALVDRWNARYRWGLVAVESSVAGRVVWRLEGTSDGAYSAFAAGEQVAIAVEGDWVMVSSNYQGLEALILANARTRADGLTLPYWAEKLQQTGGDTFGYFGVDLVRGNETLRLAISAYSLKLLFENASGSREQRQKLNEAKAWLELLAGFGHLHVVATSERSLYKLTIQTER